MKKPIPPLKGIPKNQSGINMVDLMMWLVIAALLLAAAIQGIGYYQKNAYLYQMKNDALHAAETVTAKVANTDGKFAPDTIAAGVSEVTKSTDVIIVAENGASDAAGYVLRSTHPNVDDKDVVFLSKQRGTYAPGVHVVPKGTVIGVDGGTTVVTPPPGDGSGGGGEVGGNENSVPYTPVAANGNYSPAIFDYIEAQLAFNSNKQYAVLLNSMYNPQGTPEEEAAMDWYTSGPEANALNALGGDSLANIMAQEGGTAEDVAAYIDLQNMTQRTDVEGLADLKTAMENAANAFMTTPNDETQTEWLEAQSVFYAAAVAAPLPDTALVAYAGAPDEFTDRVVPAGPIDLGNEQYSWVNFKFSLPSHLPYTWDGVNLTEPNRYDGGAVKPNNNALTSNFIYYAQKGTNDIAYWSGGVVPSDDTHWVSGKAYPFAVSVKDTTTNIIYYKTFTVTVQ